MGYEGFTQLRHLQFLTTACCRYQGRGGFQVDDDILPLIVPLLLQRWGRNWFEAGIKTKAHPLRRQLACNPNFSVDAASCGRNIRLGADQARQKPQ